MYVIIKDRSVLLVFSSHSNYFNFKPKGTPRGLKCLAGNSIRWRLYVRTTRRNLHYRVNIIKRGNWSRGNPWRELIEFPAGQNFQRFYSILVNNKMEFVGGGERKEEKKKSNWFFEWSEISPKIPSFFEVSPAARYF